MPVEIVLPAVTERVTVREIPELFARGLCPEIPEGTPRQVIDLKNNQALNQRILWHATVDEYQKEIRGAVMRGELTPRAPLTHLPIPQAAGEQLLDAFVTVENLSEYAARHGIVVRVAPDSLTSEQVNAKEQAGRYTLEEAGKHLDVETNNGGEALLMQAAMTGVLKVYAHGNTAAFPCAEIKEHRNYLEAYWDELNDWLGSNHPRIAYKYPAPSGASEKNEPPALVGIPSAEIIERFRLDKGWSEKLRKPDRNKYLLPALAQRGARGGDPHKWNPAKFAAILVEKKAKNQRAASEVVYHRFPAWADEWDVIFGVTEKGI